MVAGTAVLLQLSRLPHVHWELMWCAGAMLTLALALRAGSSALWTAVAGAVFGLGMAGEEAGSRLDQRLEPTAGSVDLSLTGRVVSLVQQRGPALRFRFRPDQDQGIDGDIAVSWYRMEHRTREPAPGEHWSLRLRLRPPDGLRNPHGADAARWALREGLAATASVRDDPDLIYLGPPGLPQAVLGLRSMLAERIRARAPPGDGRALLLALTLGDRSEIDASLDWTLRATGSAHAVAISGLHIGLVAFWVGAIAAAIRGRTQRDQVAVGPGHVGIAAGASAGILYAALSGFALPTQRACVMLAVVALAFQRRVGAGSGRSLALALTAVLLLDPLAVMDAGFWLSFAAVAALVYAAAHGEGRLQRLVRAQLVVSLGLMPVLLMLWGEVPLLAPAINLLLVPWLGLVLVPAALISVLVPASTPLALAAAELTAMGLRVAAEAPLWWSPGVLGALPALLAVVAVLLICAPRGWPARWIAAFLLLPAMFPATAPAPEAGGFELHLVDVGQGLAAVVRTRGRTLIYDTGPAYRSGGDAAASALVPVLVARRWTPDVVIVSHGDDDHAGGLATLSRRFPGRLVLSGEPDRVPGSRPCRSGQAWSWDGVRFRILGPTSAASGNDASCVLSVQGRGGSALLTGDIESGSERALRGRLGRRDVVVVPHHGSATSSSLALVEETQPQLALFPTGTHDPWDFPRAPVVARWRAAGARPLDTGAVGMISVRCGPERCPELRLPAQDRPRWWRPVRLGGARWTR